jgi:CRISPR/Cas system-associated endoribonuclease Cas2
MFLKFRLHNKLGKLNLYCSWFLSHQWIIQWLVHECDIWGVDLAKLQQLINKVKANSEKNIICIAILGQKQTQEMWKINKQGNTISKI